MPKESSRAKDFKTAKQFAKMIIEDPEYIDNLRSRARTGKLKAGMETMLWYMAYGRPVEQVEVKDTTRDAEYESWSTEELAGHAEKLSRRLRILEAVPRIAEMSAPKRDDIH